MKCEYCQGAKPLTIGKLNEPDNDDYGITLIRGNFGHGHYMLEAYGYDVHGMGTNGISVGIYFCPMCGKKLDE